MIQSGTLYTIDTSTGTGTKAPIKGARLIFKQDDTIKHQTTTNAATGSYSLDVAVGKYTVELAVGSTTVILRAGQEIEILSNSPANTFQNWLYSKSGDINDALLNSFKAILDATNDAALSANESKDVASEAAASANESLEEIKRIVTTASTEEIAGVAKIATQEDVNAGNDDTKIVTPKKLNDKLAGFVESQPIASGYSATRQYKSGDIVRVNGVYYECYHPNGCKGIDPTNPINRPSGWSSADIHAPYYWVEIGKYLMLPEIGSPIPIATMQIREGLIKYRNDVQLSATKFWRIAEQNPNLVKNGFIEIADLRANVIRGLDDGKGADPARIINSFQEDATQRIIGEFGFGGGAGFVNTVTGAFTGVPRTASVSLEAIPTNTGIPYSRVIMDNSLVLRTALEERVKNIAMYYCCRI